MGEVLLHARQLTARRPMLADQVFRVLATLESPTMHARVSAVARALRPSRSLAAS